MPPFQRSTSRGEHPSWEPSAWAWPSIEAQLPDVLDPEGTGVSTLDLPDGPPSIEAVTAALQALHDTDGAPYRQTFVGQDENEDFTKVLVDITVGLPD